MKQIKTLLSKNTLINNSNINLIIFRLIYIKKWKHSHQKNYIIIIIIIKK